MKLSDAFAPSVSIEDFFLDVLPRLHEEYLADFREFSEIPIIVSVYLRDTGDRYTVELDRDGARVEQGEMIDFPMVTVEGWEKYWDEVKRHAVELARLIEDREQELSDVLRIDHGFFADFEKFDLVFDVEFTETEDFPAIEMRLILNDYEENDRCRKVEATVPLSLLRRISEGELTPAEGARKIELAGDVKAGMDFGGMVLSHTK